MIKGKLSESDSIGDRTFSVYLSVCLFVTLLRVLRLLEVYNCYLEDENGEKAFYFARYMNSDRYLEKHFLEKG